MKNLSFIILFLLLSTTCYCQKLTQTEIEKRMSLLLPIDYSVSDTLGTKVYSGEIEKGYIVLVIVGDEHGNITDQDELITLLKELQNEMLVQATGQLFSETIMEIDSTKINKFVMITETPDMIQWDIYSFRIESKNYLIQFIYPQKTNETTTETEIIKSLKFLNG